MEVKNTADPDAVYHGTFQSGCKGDDTVTTIELLDAGTYTIVPKQDAGFYAELGGEPAPTPVYVYGDADADGTVTATDASLVLQRALVERTTFPLQNATKDWLEYIDVDNDNTVTADDAAKIMQKTLVESYIFPAEKDR